MRIFAFLGVTLVLGLSTCLPAAVTQVPGVYQEKNGFVVMEMESAPYQDWKLETNLTGYTGTGYLAWRGPYNPKPGTSNVLAYRFRIATAGDYQVKWHLYYSEVEGAEHNDWYGRLTTAAGGAVDDNSGDGLWHKVTAGVKERHVWAFGANWGPSNSDKVTFPLVPGEYILWVAPRSTDKPVPGEIVHLDRIAIYNNDVKGARSAATDLATPESPRDGLVSALRTVTLASSAGHTWEAVTPADAVKIPGQNTTVFRFGRTRDLLAVPQPAVPVANQ